MDTYSVVLGSDPHSCGLRDRLLGNDPHIYMELTMYSNSIEADVETMNEAAAGECWIPSSQEEQARLVLETYLARETGDPEPVLYDDPSPTLAYTVDEDALALLVELQLRMENGMQMINEVQDGLHILVEGYKKAKEAFNHAKYVMFEQYKDQKKPQSWWDKFNMLKAERDGWYGLLQEKKAESNLQTLWNHWKNLRDIVQNITKGDKALWAVYFQIEDKEEWLRNYRTKEIVEYYDPQSADDLEDLFISQYEQVDVYRDTHLKEENKLRID